MYNLTMFSQPVPREYELNMLIRARYPLLYIVSWEERRIEQLLRRVAEALNKKLYGWSVTDGLYSLDGRPSLHGNLDTYGPIQILDFIAASQESAIFVLKDFHPYWDERRSFQDQPLIVRRVRDIVNHLKESRKTVILLSPLLVFPPEIEKDIIVLDYSQPLKEEMEQSLERVLRSAREISGIHLQLTPESREQILNAAQGLTCSEAENVFAKSLVMTRNLDVKIIIAEKKQIIRRSNVLEYFESDEDMSTVGGMPVLKEWLKKRKLAFSERARQFGLPEPKGLLLLGVPGAGKSLIAKAIAREWNLPLLRLDLSRLFSELVGSSEQNMRSALRLAESIAPCILWLDELEKGLAGVASSHLSDAGTTARVFGSFLTWMQEKTAPVFVVATSNDISILPSEALRKGRFDEIFFIDLPSPSERREIFHIHIRRRGRDPQQFDLEELAQASQNFSGAEIENVVITALYDAFEQGRELTQQDLLRAIQNTVPLARTMDAQIQALRQWARTHARPASLPSDIPLSTGLRRLEL
jgi:ATP-dependent 26S proteasome regulatory subunit